MENIITEILSSLKAIDWITFVSSVLTSGLTGAICAYYATKYTDKRRAKELKSSEKKRFLEIKKMMPELMDIIKKSIKEDGISSAIPFFLLPSKSVVSGYVGVYYGLYENEINGLVEKFHILDTQGYVINVTENTTPKYLLNSVFIDLVKRSA